MEWLSSCGVTLVVALLTLAPLTPEVDGLRDNLKCPVRVLKGGRVRIRSRGRVAKYVCLRGAQVLGDKYSTCVRGKWDSPVPICINTGCLPVDVLHGQVLETYRGALVSVHCDLGYTLVGSPSLYCNGATWNDTAPVCRETQVKAQKWCDFESEDLCGWSHDVNHDFDWRRHNFATPSGHVGTGPSFDHTLGPGLNGHYMYLEVSSPRLENDTARLFSPVFSANNNSESCFIFWYHMFGITTGTLNVYLHKQDTVQLFSKSGDQGDQWLQAVLPLPQINSSFQIVVEGVRGAGYEGDIAIDDVKLAEGADCSTSSASSEFSPGGEDSTSATATSSAAEVSMSCEGRCYLPVVDPSMCECTQDCISNNTCCPDYVQTCSTVTPGGTSERDVATIKLITTSPPTSARMETSSTILINSTTINVLPLPKNNSVFIPSYQPTGNRSETDEVSRPIDQAKSTTPLGIKPSYSNSFTKAGVPVKFSNITQLPTTVTVLVKNQTETTQATTLPITVRVSNHTINQSMISFVSSNTSTLSIPQPTASVKTTTPGVSPTKITPPTLNSTTKPVTATLQLNTVPSTTSRPLLVPKKPKIEFVTPPPPVIFRKPVKTYRPTVLPRNGTYFNPSNRFHFIPFTFTSTTTTTTVTQNPKKMFNNSETVLKSKNDVLHPVWFTTPTLPPLGPNPGTITNRTTISTTYKTTKPTQIPTTVYFHQSNSNELTTEARWKSKYRQRDDAPVPAQYAGASSPHSPSHATHIAVLATAVLLLLVSVLASICVVRRRRINRRRMEDDELDIQFLASDEILDFTLARPSLEDIQMSETRR